MLNLTSYEHLKFNKNLIYIYVMITINFIDKWKYWLSCVSFKKNVVINSIHEIEMYILSLLIFDFRMHIVLINVEVIICFM